MIKISRFLYIHFTTLLLFAVGYINRNLDIIAVSYSVIILHELAHLLAAIAIGLKPSHIIFFPFGVNLKLKNSLVYSITDEIILYLSGPFINIILAFVCIITRQNSRLWELFYYNNISLFLFNILPILPMDGGTLLKKIFARVVGNRVSEKILKITSIILIAVLIIFELFLLIKNSFNFSVLFAVIFLTGNIFTNKEKYHLDFTKELLFYIKKDKRKIKKVKTYLIKENQNYRELARNFSLGSYYVVFKEDKNGEIKHILTEREIIENILK